LDRLNRRIREGIKSNWSALQGHLIIAMLGALLARAPGHLAEQAQRADAFYLSGRYEPVE
jgi:hypothetical protein